MRRLFLVLCSGLVASAVTACSSSEGPADAPVGRDAQPGLDAVPIQHADVGAPRDAAPADDAAPVDLDGGVAEDTGVHADATVTGPDATSFPDAFTPPDAGPATNPIPTAGAATLVQDGFGFTEGPQWYPATGVLLFTDIPPSRIHQLAPPSTISLFRDMTNLTNGLAVDHLGRLIAAEHATQRVTRTLANGTIEVVTDRYDGRRFASPNDIVVRADGTIYFTDPPYGLEGRTPELDFHGVFRVDPAGVTHIAWRGTMASRPNGIALSPDQRLLYFADSEAGVVYAMDIAADGSTSNDRIVVRNLAGPDGMAVDQTGNLFMAVAGGVAVHSPTGVGYGVLPVPGISSNCTFGDPDMRTLYVTNRSGLYRIRLAVPGLL